MGKTHFATTVLHKTLKQTDEHGTFHLLSYDQIRKPGLDKWLSANHGGKIDEGLVATAAETTEKWQSILRDALRQASKDKHTHYIFLDKNFPLSDLAPTQSVIKAFEQDGNKVNKVAIVPIDHGTMAGYPLSLGFFTQCYLRCLNRKGHLTFPSEDPERVVKLLARFFRQFKDVKFDSTFLAKGFDQLMPVALTEGEHFQLPSNLETILSSIIT